MKFIKLAVAVLLFAMSTSARDLSNLPERPHPQPETHSIIRPFVSTARLVRDAADFRDRQASTLLVFEAGFLISDAITTSIRVQQGAHEADPIARLFIGRYPTWKSMAIPGTLQLFGTYYLGERMHRSSNRWVRRAWWLPQVAAIASNFYGTSVGVSQLSRGLK